jgi:methyl-accepting chemotaxis protein
MKLKLSYRLSIYVGGILFLGIGLLLFHDIRSDVSLIENIGLGEAERLSTILFDQLHTSMKLDGGRAENRAIVERFNQVKDMEGIRIIHGPALDRQYGVEEDELPQDRYERSALAGNTVRKTVRHADGYSIARFILPIHMRDECRRCHQARTGDVIGAVSVKLSLKKFEIIMERHTGRMLIWGLGILTLTLCAVLLTMHRRFLAPVKRLKAGVGELSKGDLSHRVNITTEDEFEELGESFDEMAASLLDINKKLNSISVKHARLVEMAADAIVLIDLETQRLVDANPAAEMLSGYSIEELRGRSSDELFPAEKKRRLHRAGGDSGLGLRNRRQKLHPGSLEGHLREEGVRGEAQKTHLGARGYGKGAHQGAQQVLKRARGGLR